jgi:hypothetical protein
MWLQQLHYCFILLSQHTYHIVSYHIVSYHTCCIAWLVGVGVFDSVFVCAYRLYVCGSVVRLNNNNNNNVAKSFDSCHSKSSSSVVASDIDQIDVVDNDTLLLVIHTSCRSSCITCSSCIGDCSAIRGMADPYCHIISFVDIDRILCTCAM